MISLIVAYDSNQLIGKDGWMPWDNKEDLKHFRNYTMNKTLLVGRKTFEGFPKPLPNRYHYVLTRSDIQYSYDTVEVIHTIDDVVKKFKNSDDELVVIGGSQVYKTALPYVDKMVISVMDGEYEGDTYFPEYNKEDFIVESIEEKDGFSVYTLIRKGQ